MLASPVGVMDDIGYYFEHPRVEIFGVEPSATPESTWAPAATWDIALALDVDRSVRARGAGAGPLVESEDGSGPSTPADHEGGVAACVETDLWEDGSRSCVQLGAHIRPLRPESVTAELVVQIHGRSTDAAAPEGFRLDHDQLVTPRGTVALGEAAPGRSEARIVVAPDGVHAAVVGCSCRSRRDDWAHCAVDVADLSTLHATRLADGAHHVGVRFAHDAALYVETRVSTTRWDGDRRIRRYPPDGAPPSTLPRGLVLDIRHEDPCYPLDG